MDQRVVARRPSWASPAQIVVGVGGVLRRELMTVIRARPQPELALKASAVASGKKYISLQVVMPPRSISAAASRLPSPDERSSRRGGFGRPDGFVEPAHQGQIVGEATHQGMAAAVQIDEPGTVTCSVRLTVSRRRSAGGLGSGQDVDDTAVQDGDGMVFQGRVGGLDGMIQRASMREVDGAGVMAWASGRKPRHGGGLVGRSSAASYRALDVTVTRRLRRGIRSAFAPELVVAALIGWILPAPMGFDVGCLHALAQQVGLDSVGAGKLLVA